MFGAASIPEIHALIGNVAIFHKIPFNPNELFPVSSSRDGLATLIISVSLLQSCLLYKQSKYFYCTYCCGNMCHLSMCTSKGSLFSKIWSHMLVFRILFHCQVVGPFIDTPSLLFGDYSPIVMVRVFVCGVVHSVSQSDYMLVSRTSPLPHEREGSGEHVY